MMTSHPLAASRQKLVPHTFLFARIVVAVLLMLGGGQLAARAATITVGSGAGNDYHDLQLAINAAQPGDTIIVQAGETFYGGFVLKNKNTTSTAYITIQSSAVASLPAGARVGPAQSSLMPHLVTQNYPGTSSGPPAIRTEAYAHHYRLIGLDMTSDPSAYIYDLLALGDGSSAQNSLTLVPYSLVVDRCLIRAAAAQPAKRGVALNSRDTQITNSHIAGFKLEGDDSQAICMWNGPGQYEITNNYVEGGAENIMVAGGVNWISGLIPSDITIRGNHITKPLSWRPGSPDYAGTPWRARNLLELKTGKRITVEGNLFENNWQGGADSGNPIGLAPISNDEGNIPSWQVPQIEDIIIRKNIIRHAAGGVLLDGKWQTGDSSYLRRVRIENNVFEDITGAWGDNYGRLFVLNDGTDEVTIEHNTAFNASSAVQYSTGAANTNFVFRNNIVNGDVWNGLNNPGDTALNPSFPGAVWTKNVQVGGGLEHPYYDGTYSTPAHTGNYFPTNVSGVGFVDYANGNFRLSSSSVYKGQATDGKDIGADIDAIEAAMAGGQSLSLDGSGDYVLVPNSASLAVEGPITVEAWFKTDSNTTYQTIVAKESFQVAGTGGGYELQLTNTGKVRLNFYQSHTTYTTASGTTTVTTGVWHHAAATFDGTTRRLFLDGVLEASVAGGGPVAGTGSLRIGRRNSSANTYYFDGLIDEVRVSNTALYSAAFTPQVYLTATPGTTVGLWKFDDGTADDSSGNSNDGALQGNAAFSTDIPANYSLSLNGTNAFVLVPNSTSLNITGTLTLEAWVKTNTATANQTIVARENLQQATGGGYELQITNTGKLRMNLWTTPTTYGAIIGATTLTTGVWHHVVGVADSTERRLYVDGVLDATVSGALFPATGTGSLRIGRRSHTTNTYYFNGLVDEVRVSNAALYNTNFTPQRGLAAGASTAGLWKFNDQTAADYSGNANNGTLQGTAVYSTDVP